LARLRPVLVVISSQHVAGFAFQRLPTISRVASLTSSSFAEAVESRPSINAVSSSRVCCEAGSLVAMGCSFAGLPSPLLNHTLQRMHPAKFPATLRLHHLASRRRTRNNVAELEKALDAASVSEHLKETSCSCVKRRQLRKLLACARQLGEIEQYVSIDR